MEPNTKTPAPPDGFAGLTYEQAVDRFATVGEIYDAARETLKEDIWDFLEGGAGDEVTLADNRAAFNRWKFLPRVLSGISTIDTSTTFLGNRLSIPVITAPFGADQLFHQEGHLAVARANAQSGVISIVPEASSFSLEDVAKEAPSAAKIFQLHPLGSKSNFLQIVERAKNVGYGALCLTVDCPTGGWRERNMRNRYSLPMCVIEGNYGNGAEVFGALFSDDSPIWSWAEVTEVMSESAIPFMIKGILTADDAKRALDAGASAILVSNHGGRQLDGTPAALDQLPEIDSAVGDHMEIAIDSGIRRGSDVIKAIALGADVVVIGRGAAMAIAAGGEEGLIRLFELFKDEIINVMRLLGRASIEAIDQTLLAPAKGGTR